MPLANPDFASTMLERTRTILCMKCRKLPLDFLKEFDLPQLTTCCDRLDASTLCSGIESVTAGRKPAQRELIQNPEFVSYLETMLPLIPEEEPQEQQPAPGYSRYSRSYGQTPTKHSKRSEFLSALWELLEVCQAHERNITQYPANKVADALLMRFSNGTIRLAFLENFASMELSEDSCKIVTGGLENCVDVPLILNDVQKKLLMEPCTACSGLFRSAPFCEVWKLLDSAPNLLDIARLLYQHEIEDSMNLENYTSFTQNVPEYSRLLHSIVNHMEPNAMNCFLRYWKRGGCPLRELRYLERWICTHPGQDWDSLLSTYSGYINLLYGKRFQTIDLSAVPDYQEDILIYAIVNRKKHFIQMVDANAECFSSLPHTSIIFQERLYKENFNLNELTERDLKDCGWMDRKRLPAERLIPGRRYTFPELRALYGSSPIYFSVYHAMEAPRQDDRLKAFQQLRKRNVLWKHINEQEISSLAKCLDRKPLYEWLYHDFRHIKGLTATDTAQILAHFDDLQPLISDMEIRQDVLLALRSLDLPERFSSMDVLKQNIIQADKNWQSLSSVMELSPEFMELNWETIERFLLMDGANIAETYRKDLAPKQQTAFLRVVKVELMGQLKELKYFEGDLARELNMPLTRQIMEDWKKELQISKDGLEVKEYDDFFSTMLLGVQPQRTCLSYQNGAYRECLLSSFDSNKKILYAVLDGRIVGRAFLRLTKGRLTNTDISNDGEDGHFTFVDLENIQEVRQDLPHEQLTLFLERPYISGANPEETAQIQHLFVELARQKAEALDILLVLSTDYRCSCGNAFVRTQFDIYISKSKAGAQYLDSLNGRASVSCEDSYTANTFLILNCA